MASNSFSLGLDPLTFTLDISRGARFDDGILTADGADWPVGTEAKFVFEDDTEWVATVVGNRIGWSQDATSVDALLDSPQPYHVELRGPDNALWGIGVVAAHG